MVDTGCIDHRTCTSSLARIHSGNVYSVAAAPVRFSNVDGTTAHGLIVDKLVAPRNWPALNMQTASDVLHES
jgi:hypothetical protein